MPANEVYTAGGAISGALGKPVEELASWQGSTTSSLGSTCEVAEEPILMPTVADCRRLAKMKAEQEQRLKMVKARVDRLGAHERQTWKDVASTQRKSLQAQGTQWRRQAQQEERLHIERQLLAQEQAVRDRAQAMRQQVFETKGGPRSRKFEENQTNGVEVREDSKRLMAALHKVREQSLQSKVMQIEVRRHKQRQNLLRRELERTRREQCVQDANALRYAELQEEIVNSGLSLAAAEREELHAVSRLQNSQGVRSEVVNQMEDIEARGLIDVMANHLPLASSDMAAEGAGPPPANHFVNNGGAPAQGLRSVARDQGKQSPRSSRSRGNGHMASGCNGLGQITEERQEDEGIEQLSEDQHEIM